MSQGNSKTTLGILIVGIALSLGPSALQAQYGRTYGGYGGGYLGALGGSAVGTALVGAAGISNPLLGGAIITTSALGTGLLGARVGSHVGNGVDDRFSEKQVWGTVGAVSGALMGFAFAPGGSLVARFLGAGVGALAGGLMGKYLSNKADDDFNPRTVGALAGGVNGALLGGPVGAAVGVPLGYIGGTFLDKNVFADPQDTWRLGQQAHTYSPPRLFGDNGFDQRGLDREGYDRLGYDKAGYDREGYDRFGYDRDEIDRMGYNMQGLKKREPRQKSGTWGQGHGRSQDEYDKQVYDGYWGMYRDLGGDYPRFDESHWAKFPDDLAPIAQESYETEAPDVVSITEMSAALPSSQSLSQLKESHDAAIKRLQELSSSASTTADALQEAHTALQDAERALSDAMKK